VHYNNLSESFPHFHRESSLVPCGNVENFGAKKVFHISATFSTTFSTGVVENKSTTCNSKEGFPHFHSHYYYY
jgi:hypothetical protein